MRLDRARALLSSQVWSTRAGFIVQGGSGHELTRGTVVSAPDCRAQLQLDAASPKLWLGTNAGYPALYIAGHGIHDSSEAVAYLLVLYHPNDEVAAQVALLGAGCEGGAPAVSAL